jgi:hypothetical protein
MSLWEAFCTVVLRTRKNVNHVRVVGMKLCPYTELCFVGTEYLARRYDPEAAARTSGCKKKRRFEREQLIQEDTYSFTVSYAHCDD